MNTSSEAFPGERQQLIRDRLALYGRVIAADLASEFKVSEHSIRRDLSALAAAGFCKRVYGGAILLPVAEGPMDVRVRQDTARKGRLAQAAASLLSEGQHVFMDAGSTNLAIARAIDPRLPLTVGTNSPLIAVQLMKLPCAKVILLGGQLDPVTGGVIGLTAVRQLQQFSFDLCFLGACAIDADNGITAFGLDDAEFKRAVVAASGQVVVAVTNQKLSSIAHYQVASCEEVSALVVEHDAPRERLEPFLSRISNVLTGARE
ncbi:MULTISPECIES: DeoR/GlpR family DNA-binding transcription regulator [Pseudomonas]|jgi:DeoR/GlpR family transcriptional regulator of sugar metabolism|uniref:DeoR/GlpR family DNA-binding transcription regulator n=1 Tax=Pseudomonas TaxID=286 RepID=UPI0008760956|nr:MULTISPECIES: DeoR/GlpR family DNA-binding transcription regulator [Pseudomonas]MDB6442470.1 DeoR/GlpR family DNA-binding transcription regulator [Pseudomonas sp. 21TX0197]MDT8905697.1 DeoR/GlpR family DNA-binding transcription regulator [Pseudomonas prosekii]NHN68110.1 DeoR/GlpR transcriptional regulator [Pseudomonas fluorescens]ROO34871.1 decarboxylase [Pseudomonas sp. 7SR1]ROO42299.1 decarboxylase [Pseudomonas sp. AF76]